ncbi:oleate hydratase, partial [Clostridium perfringens]
PAMEAVYTLLNVARGVPEVFGSCYDVRVLLDSTSKMMDGKKLTDLKLPLIMNLLEKQALKKVSGTVIEDILKRYNII